MAPLATVGILSIGDMGMGIAKLLLAKNYRVVTNVEGRRYGACFILHPVVIAVPFRNFELFSVKVDEVAVSNFISKTFSILHTALQAFHMK
jgi:hypothetical protein